MLLLLPTLAFANNKNIELNIFNSVPFNDSFNSRSVTRAIEKLKHLDGIKYLADKPIYLVLNSGGGSITAGLRLINFVKGMTRKVNTISHFSASMAFETVEQLGDRLAFESSILMSHKARGGVYGEYPGQLDSRLTVNKRELDIMEKAVVNRTKGKHTLKSYRNLIENEYWCVSEDCIKQGFLDNIIVSSCDKSLGGSHIISEQFIDSGYVIKLIYEYSNCALQTAPLSFTALVNGNDVFSEDFTRSYDFDKAEFIKLNAFIESKKDLKINHIKHTLGLKK
jgi:ATP-dependent protease ClpP protease subunit